MKINFRELNKNECYACDRADIRTMFSDCDDLTVNFGSLGRSYRFDSKFIKRPALSGIVIMDMEINHRDGMSEMTPFLNLYVLRDDRYNSIQKKVFVKRVLPAVYEWYCRKKQVPETYVPGVETILVEWTGDQFHLHAVRYR